MRNSRDDVLSKYTRYLLDLFCDFIFDWFSSRQDTQYAEFKR